jgi:outer membrane murein-binding lipoprotein Lpp
MSGADRTGKRRPRAEKPRDRQVRLLLSDEELVELRRLAGERGISVQRMLVDDALAGTSGKAGSGRRALGRKVDELLPALREVRAEVAHVGRNINQLAEAANAARYSRQGLDGDALADYFRDDVYAALCEVIVKVEHAADRIAGAR